MSDTRVQDPKMIQVSNEHHKAGPGLMALLLTLEEAFGQKVWTNLAGQPGQMRYVHLGRTTTDSVRRACAKSEIAEPTDFVLEDAASALTKLTPDIPLCPDGHLPYDIGSQDYVREGACPIDGCGKLIGKKRVIRNPLNWVTATIGQEMQTHDRTLDPANPIPITEEGIRAVYTVDPALNAILAQEEADLVEFMAYVVHKTPFKAYGEFPAYTVLNFIQGIGQVQFRRIPGNTIQLAARNSRGFWKECENSGNKPNTGSGQGGSQTGPQLIVTEEGKKELHELLLKMFDEFDFRSRLPLNISGGDKVRLGLPGETASRSALAQAWVDAVATRKVGVDFFDMLLELRPRWTGEIAQVRALWIKPVGSR